MSFNLEGFFHNCPILDSCRPIQTFCFGDGGFQLCNRCHTLTTWIRQSSSSYRLPFLQVFLAKINYEIHDKELLAIVDAFEE